jgi:NADPH2:quinone reductase
MPVAIRIHATGGPETLSIDDVPMPTPQPGQVVVQTAAAGVNFIDIYHRTGAYPLPLPATLGVEASGTVVDVADDVSTLAVGDRVAWPWQFGSYATHVAVDATKVVPVPSGVDLRVAAAAMVQGITAHFLARSIVPLRSGDPVLVHAGAGGVGLLLTQLLAADGVRVFTTVGSAGKETLSRAAGAEDVFGYSDFVERTRAATGGRGVRAVFDGVGQATFDAGLDALAVRGAMVLFGAASGKVAPIDPQVLGTKGSLMLTRPSLAHFATEPDELARRASDVFAALGDGTLEVRVSAEFGLTDAADAHRALEGRGTTGKVLLIP